jgi:hypothetical protein
MVSFSFSFSLLASPFFQIPCSLPFSFQTVFTFQYSNAASIETPISILHEFEDLELVVMVTVNHILHSNNLVREREGGSKRGDDDVRKSESKRDMHPIDRSQHAS